MSSETSDLSSSWLNFLGWVETNAKQLVIGLVVGLVLAFVIVTYRWNAHQTERRASGQLLQLRHTARPGSSDTAATAEDYLKVASQFSGTDAGERAELLAAGSLFTSGQYTEAHTRFFEILAKSGNSPLAPAAAYGVATSLEAQGKTDEALPAYQQVSARYSRSPLAEQARLGVARIHQSKNQPALALQIYDEMTADRASTPAGSQAFVLKQELLKAHPELVKTNTAAPLTLTNAPVILP